MSTATATAYRSRFAGRIAPARSRKSPENKPFHGRWSTFSGKAHCIKDRVLLDLTIGTSPLFTNTYEEVPVNVTKIWSDDSNRDGKRFPVTVKLIARKGNGDVITFDDSWAKYAEVEGNGTLSDNTWTNTITVKNLKLDTAAQWTGGWTCLPKYYQGQVIYYSVEEIEIPTESGYKKTSETTVRNPDGSYTTTITNTRVSDTVTGFTFTKTWDDSNNRDGKRPSPEDFLLKNVRVYMSDAYINGVPYTDVMLVPVKNGTTGPIYLYYYQHASGDPIKDSSNDPIRVTTQGANGQVPATVTIVGNNGSDTNWQQNVESQTIGYNTYYVSYQNLPVNYKTNNQITYTMMEVQNTTDNTQEREEWLFSVPRGEGITAEQMHRYTFENETASYAIEYPIANVDGQNYKFAATNKHAPDTININVKKTWTDDAGVVLGRPESISVQLYADGVKEGNPQNLNSENGWEFNWLSLDTYYKYQDGKVGDLIAYTVQEDGVPTGYTVTVNEDTTTDPDNTLQRTIENQYKTGSLKVVKQVDSDVAGDLLHPFHFRVSLKGINEGTFNGRTFNPNLIEVTKKDSASHSINEMIAFDQTGVASFTLADGQYVEITKLPIDMQYEVEEYGNTDEETSFLTNFVTTGKQSGTIDQTQQEKVFVNKRKTGELTLTKTVARQNIIPGDEDLEFSFTVTLAAPDNSTLDYSKNRIQYKVGNGNAVSFKSDIATISLKHGQTVTITGLPVKTTYIVTENMSGSDSFFRAFTPANGESNNNAGNACGTINNGDLTTGGELDTITAVNTRKTGSLKLNKTVSSPVAKDHEDDYTFTVMLTKSGSAVSDAYYSAMITGTDGTSTVVDLSGLASGSISLNVTVKGDSYTTISGIPVDVLYTVSEAQQTNFDQPVVTYTDTDGKHEISSSNTPEVTVANNRQKGNLEVEKNVVSDVVQDKTKEYNFSVTLNILPANLSDAKVLANSIIVKKYQKKTGDQTEDNLIDADYFPTRGVANFTLQNDQYVKIEGLPVGVSYTVTETTQDDYITKSGTTSANTESNNQNGSISTKDQSDTVLFENTRRTGTLTLNKEFDESHWIQGDNDIKFPLNIVLTPPSGTTLNLGAGTMVTVYSKNKNNQITKLTTQPTWTKASSGNTYSTQVEVSKNESIIIEGIPVGTTYSVTEADTAKFAKDTSTKTGTFVVASDSTSKIVKETVPSGSGGTTQDITPKTFTNDRKTGDLEIEKDVDSTVLADRNALYRMKVTLSPEPKNKVYAITATTVGDNLGLYDEISDVSGKTDNVADGKVTFVKNGDSTEAYIYVRGGQKVTIKDIPTDVTCTVVEDTYSDFTTTNPASGTIINNSGSDRTITATVRNVRKKGDLKLGKTVNSAVTGDASHAFQFEVVLNTLIDGSHAFAVEGGAEGETVTFTPDTETTTSVGYVSVTPGQPKTIKDLPYNVAYTVTEVSDSSLLTPENKTKEATYLHNFVTEPENRTRTGTTTDSSISAYLPSEASFTNTRKTGQLTLNKALVNAIHSDPTREFNFTVTLTNADGLSAEAISQTTGKNFAAVDGSDGKSVSAIISVSQNSPVTIGGIPVGTEYTVTETAPSDFDAVAPKVTVNEQGTVKNTISVNDTNPTKGDQDSVTVTNTRNTGTLTLSKVVHSAVAAENETEYTFKVTLTSVSGTAPSNTSYTLTAAANGTTVPITYVDAQGTSLEMQVFSFDNNGKVYFTVPVSEGNDITIAGIPVGVSYEVSEVTGDETNENFNAPVYSSGRTGTITRDAASNAVVTNSRKTGKLKVEKSVASNLTGDHTKDFTFTVSLNGLEKDKSQNVVDPSEITIKKYQKGSESDTEVQTSPAIEFDAAAGTATFTLADDQYADITGLPLGVSYTVTETADNNFITKYGSDAESLTDGNYYTDTIDETNSKLFWNTRKTGRLTLNKALVNAIPGDPDKEFTFRVTLTNTTGLTTEGIVGASFTSVQGDANSIAADVPIKQGQRITITGIPVGTTYTVSETAPVNFTSDVTDSEGKDNNNKPNGTGMISVDNNKTPSFGDEDAVTITNTRDTGSLTLKKNVRSALASENAAEYTFKVTLNSGTGTRPAAYFENLTAKDSNNNAVTIQPLDAAGDNQSALSIDENGDTFFTINIREGNDVTISGIPVGVTFTVSEGTPEKFGSPQVQYSDNDQDSENNQTIRKDVPHLAEVTNIRYTGILTVEKNVVSSLSGDSSKEFTFMVELKGLVKDTAGHVVDPEEITIKKYQKGSAAPNPKSDTPISTDQIIKFDAETGIVTLTLADDQYAYITGLPLDVQYTVSEAPDNDFITKNGSGVNDLSENRSYSSTIAEANSRLFENTRKTGALKIDKAFKAENGFIRNWIPEDDDIEFTFNVTLTPPSSLNLGEGTSVAVSTKTKPTDGSEPVTATESLSSSDSVITVKVSRNKSVIIDGIPVGTRYIVAEDLEGTNFTADIISMSGIISAEENTAGNGAVKDYPTGGTAVAADSQNPSQKLFTNDRKTGDLVIEKAVDSTVLADRNALYRMKVTLSPEPNNKVYDITATTVGDNLGLYDETGSDSEKADNVADGKVTFVKNSGSTEAYIYVRGGQKVTIKDIPMEVTCTVAEDTYSDFTTTNPASGTIINNGDNARTINATVRNERLTGNLAVSKEVESTVTGDATHPFRFKVELNALIDSEHEFAVSGGAEGEKVTFTPDSETGKSEAVITMISGQTKTIIGLPGNIDYTVSEVSDNVAGEDVYLQNFVTTILGDKGTISETLSTTSFTNKRKTGQLTLNKALVNAIPGDEAKTFSFIVTLTNPDGLTADGLTGGDFAAVAESNGKSIRAAIDVSQNNSVTITGIPVGTTYSVSETAPADFNVVAPSVSVSEQGTVSRMISVNDDNTIDKGDHDSVTVTNTRNTDSLTLSKVVNSAVESENAAVYTFKVVLNGNGTQPENTSYSVEAKADNKDVEITYLDKDDEKLEDQGLTFDNEGKVYFTVPVKEGHDVIISGIPVGVTYEVAEEGARTNFDEPVIEYPVSETHRISKGASPKVTITNNRQNGTLKIEKGVVSSLAGDHAKDFIFTVQLNGLTVVDGKTVDTKELHVQKKRKPNGDETGDQDVETSDEEQFSAEGKATFTLKDGQYAYITGLPIDVSYTVEETADNDFITSYGSDADHLRQASSFTGTIGETNEGLFQNFRKTGSLEIIKAFKTEHWISGDDDIDFTFNVTLTPPENGTLNLDEGTSVNVRSDKDPLTHNGNVITLQVSKNSPVILDGIPVGVQYTIEETGTGGDNFNRPASMTGRIIADEDGSVIDSYTQDSAAAADSATYSNPSDKTFVNDRKTGSLKIGKSVTSPIATEKTADYSFRITLASHADSEPVTAPRGGFRMKTFTPALSADGTDEQYGDEQTLSFVHGVQEINIPGGKYVIIENIPTDVDYKVEELNSDWFNKEYTHKLEGEDAAGGIIAVGENIEHIANNRKTADLILKKTVDSPLAEEQTAYYFMEVNLLDAHMAEVPGIYDVDIHAQQDGKDVVLATKTVDFADGEAIIPVQGGGENYIVIKDLPYDLHYTVTEVTDPKAVCAFGSGYVNSCDKDIFNVSGEVVVRDNKKIPADGATVNVVNRRTEDRTTLTFGKTVVHGDPEKKFTFTVTFQDTTTEYPYEITTAAGDKIRGKIKSGGTLTLADNETATIKDLLIKMNYSVTETREAGFSSTIDGTEIEEDEAITVSGITARKDPQHTFMNTYSTRGAAEISVIKALENRILQEGQFEFTISAEGDSPLKDASGEIIPTEDLTVKNSGANNAVVIFPELHYSLPDAGKTYYYKIVEKDFTQEGTNIGVSKSGPVSIYVKVVVPADDGDGDLGPAVVTYHSAIPGTEENRLYRKVFNNAYTADGSITFTGKKTLVNRKLEDKEFTFHVLDEAGNTIREARNDADGNIIFDPITYSLDDLTWNTEEEKFDKAARKYTIVETAGDDSNVTYSDERYEVTVTLEDNGDGTIEATADKSKDGAVFTNTYNASGSITFTAAKTLNNRKLEKDEFTFQVQDEEGNKIKEAKNDANGKITFDAITYDLSDLRWNASQKKYDDATRKYKIVEIPGNDSSVDYSDEAYEVTVTLHDNGEGTIVATPDKPVDGASFINIYSASGAGEIFVKKTLTGRDWADSDSFTFTITAEEGTPMPANTQISISKDTAEKTASFGKIAYDEAGTYTYTVKEVAGTADGMAYDVADHVVTIKTVDDGNGNIVAAEDSSLVQKIEINNPFTPAEATLEVTKDFNDWSKADGFTFRLSTVEDSPMPRDTEGKVVDTAVATEESKTAVFGSVLYEKAGTYEYVITEVNDGVEGVSYDAKEHHVVVTVTKDAANKLTAVVKYEGQDELVVTNTYYETSASVRKVWIDKDDKNRPEVLKVQLLADGEPVEDGEVTLSVDNDWSDGVENLPKYKDGTETEIKYTWEEPEVDGYELSDVTTNGTETVLTNTILAADVRVRKVDATNGKPLAGASLQILDAEGEVIDEWISTAELHETAGLTPGVAYTVHEVKAPDGYGTAADTAFVLNPDGTFDAQRTSAHTDADGNLVVENGKTGATLSVTKRLTMGEGEDEIELGAEDSTFYVQLFFDEACTTPVSEIKPLEYKNRASATVTFDVDYGCTYYVKEVSQDGEPIEIGMEDGVVYLPVFEEDNNSVTIEENGGNARVTFKNEFMDIPSGYFRTGHLTVDKHVLTVDGEELPSDEIFFAGIFEDAELTTLSHMAEEPVLALVMDGESSASAMTNVQIVPGETVTLYITEVDEEGIPVSEDPDFVYEVTVDQDSVSIDMDHQAAVVTIINQEKPEPTPTPEPTETPEPTATPTPAPTVTVTNTPASPGAKTGDTTDTAGYLAMLLLAGMVLLTSGFFRKRKE